MTEKYYTAKVNRLIAKYTDKVNLKKFCPPFPSWKGTADFLGYNSLGKVLQVEIKGESKKLSSSQSIEKARVEIFNGEYFLINSENSFDKFKKYLDKLPTIR